MPGQRRPGETNDARLERLRRWALVFAIAVPIASVWPVVLGFGLSALFVPLVVLWIVTLWRVNRWTVTLMDQSMPPPATPWFRIVLAFAGAFVIACAVTFWYFEGDIAAIQASADPSGWDADFHRLDDELRQKRQFADSALPTVEQDSNVKWLAEHLDKVEADLREWERNTLCELDGTCGTHVPGKAAAYYEKANYRDRLSSEKNDLANELKTERVEAQRKIDQYAMDQQAARVRIDEILRQLVRLGPRPQPPGSVAALQSIARQQPFPVAGVSTGALLAFLTADWLGLRFVVRRICGPAVPSSPIRSLVNGQTESDNRRAQGAVYPDDLNEKMRDEYFPAEEVTSSWSPMRKRRVRQMVRWTRTWSAHGRLARQKKR